MKKNIAAGCLVYKNTMPREWLVCKHSSHGGWVFPKGLVGDRSLDESYEEAARRETKEEGGVEGKIIGKLPHVYTYTYQLEGELIKKEVHYFLMLYESGDPNNHDWEMSEAGFYPEDEVSDLLTYPADKKAFKDAKKMLDDSH
ncbi:hypothetical protein A2957_01395 [Candidatus Roizmanbacteria bacterium RIFCSPLOWO2_01_FULL_38_11]|uniref:Nudix hydrolase domain-containing protein n=1 Tax=Candidatus Roizmanbacteria bacterium RIFCSPLOWO2_01_FULL_38_11 TaxID=1802060 RepID=A0A1F7IPE2_9BACT|nr:MAG: hypothetical protein A2957_01395 [Candidatus Roizmanbacteria bacterium RIFCSPLOWO2_01_FULL_38_11]